MKAYMVITKILACLGVDKAFGIPGSSNPFFQAFYSEGINPILSKHETGAGWMAIGYQLYAGHIPVVLCSRGPGVAQVIPALAAAKNDYVPIVILTTYMSPNPEGRKFFQEYSGNNASASQYQLAQSAAKCAIQIRDSNDIPKIYKAWQTMMSHPQGPVYIEVNEAIISKSVTNLNINKISIGKVNVGFPTENDLEATIERILEFKKPVFLLGAGLRTENTQKLVTCVVNDLGACVVTTLKGKGCINNSWQFNYGVIGMCGNQSANNILNECDGIIAIGTSLNEMTIGVQSLNTISSRGVKIIWVNLLFDKKLNTKHKIICCKCEINAFLKKLYFRTNGIQKKRWKTPISHNANEINGVFNILNQLNIPQKVYFVESVIQAANNLIIDKPSQFFAITNSASLGYALPAAIGAASSKEESAFFISIVGDGGFQMSAMELMTATNYQIKVICIVLVNNALGPILRSFKNKKLPQVACTFKNPDFSYLCNSFGIKGGHAHDLKSFEDLMTLSVNAKSSCIVAVDYQDT